MRIIYTQVLMRTNTYSMFTKIDIYLYFQWLFPFYLCSCPLVSPVTIVPEYE